MTVLSLFMRPAPVTRGRWIGNVRRFRGFRERAGPAERSLPGAAGGRNAPGSGRAQAAAQAA